METEQQGQMVGQSGRGRAATGRGKEQGKVRKSRRYGELTNIIRSHPRKKDKNSRRMIPAMGFRHLWHYAQHINNAIVVL